MKPIDLTETLKPYKSGWVAIENKQYKSKVVAHAATFVTLVKKVKGRKDIFLMPASKNYFGFITCLDA